MPIPASPPMRTCATERDRLVQGALHERELLPLSRPISSGLTMAAMPAIIRFPGAGAGSAIDAITIRRQSSGARSGSAERGPSPGMSLQRSSGAGFAAAGSLLPTRASRRSSASACSSAILMAVGPSSSWWLLSVASGSPIDAIPCPPR